MIQLNTFVYLILGLIPLIYIANQYLIKFNQPFYKLQARYKIIDLPCGKTEILKIKKENEEYTPNNTPSIKNISKKDVKIVFFTGHRGYIKFYDKFLHKLYNLLGQKYTICGIGQLGQFNYKNKPLHNKYTIQDQIEQKKQFLEHLIKKKPNVQFIIVTHSIGSYIALNILDKIPPIHILYVFNLFPVIERIGQTPYVKSHLKMPFFPFIYIMSFFFAIYSFFPQKLKRFIGNLYVSLSLGDIKEKYNDLVEIGTEYFNYRNFYSMLYMIASEYDTINERQYELMSKYADKTMYYYGVDDDWCPQYYYFDLKNEMPHINAQLDEKGILHAFVIGASQTQAQLLTQWIKRELNL
ncbi:hypothetical protein IMG5_101720 [Ichthyophthirius multifiliis]|uniref:Lipid droplet-associated hydrolase n=1 Tax=Ichthyophthirius multifiliis TaxID=5932 RepID=G0QSK1_ICHMU|nr:hypothetical protein IMG5_101720 [Ichthyophthirius multifiliis]EGR31800.1 hypothetical protein IMG5_101720 [Ichthyophthirius multifiliis]|eukprot:XP_004035286.1 hypothetical protein IMG5_101720 [Ichthyophthirius multifiliis]